MRFDEWEALAPQLIFVSATPGSYEETKQGQLVRQLVRPTGLIDPEVEVRPALHQVDDLLSEIRSRVQQEERVLVTVLTKRMAEDLTDYMADNGVRVRYLHSDIETVERMEILRDLRLGVFDVLIGINLLREGLDLPEVSLVAVIDADKEGFLRSERSLIQTIGRAARNLRGKAILYGDKITGSMQRAIATTLERRRIQTEFNIAHGIIPQGIKKAVTDVMEGGFSAPGSARKGKGGMRNLAEREAGYMAEELPASRASLERKIGELREKMMKHARNLEFEEAANIRDRLGKLNDQLLAL